MQRDPLESTLRVQKKEEKKNKREIEEGSGLDGHKGHAETSREIKWTEVVVGEVGTGHW